MKILSLDLAYKNFKDNGIVIFDLSSSRISAKNIRWDNELIKSASQLVDRLGPILKTESIDYLGIDGPQAWKDENNGFQHARVCEVQAHTPSKTGTFATGKPKNYLPFISFSIEVFNYLEELGYTRFSGTLKPKNVMEVFPYRSWRNCLYKPLSAKSKCSKSEIEEKFEEFKKREHIEFSFQPNHDELQATIAGSGLIRLAKGDMDKVEIAGIPPFRKDGIWLEGFIVLPTEISQ